jgi:hypothetical protein
MRRPPGHRHDHTEGDTVTDTDYATALARRSPAFADLLDENAELRDRVTETVGLLDRVRELRFEIRRLAPDAATPGIAELRSIVDAARRVADYPMTDRCGCGWTDETRVEFHRRGSDECRVEATP